jgi:hypothetical protein
MEVVYSFETYLPTSSHGLITKKTNSLYLRDSLKLHIILKTVVAFSSPVDVRNCDRLFSSVARVKGLCEMLVLGMPHLMLHTVGLVRLLPYISTFHCGQNQFRLDKGR